MFSLLAHTTVPVMLCFTTGACPQLATAVVEPCSTVPDGHSLLEHTALAILLVSEALCDEFRSYPARGVLPALPCVLGISL